MTLIVVSQIFIRTTIKTAPRWGMPLAKVPSIQLLLALLAVFRQGRSKVAPSEHFSQDWLLQVWQQTMMFWLEKRALGNCWNRKVLHLCQDQPIQFQVWNFGIILFLPYKDISTYDSLHELLISNIKMNVNALIK